MPDPLHPAIVHLPLALAFLIPLLALGAAVAIHTRWLPSRVWVAVVLLQALLVGSAWLAAETGEEQEERVERVVAERPLEDHEEAAERFVVIAGLGLLVVAAGLLRDRAGQTGRVVAVVSSLGVLAAATVVGHSGGELVYRHGAASAYVKRVVSFPVESSEEDGRFRAREEHDSH
jgi:uncharacterized membrane protein